MRHINLVNWRLLTVGVVAAMVLSSAPAGHAQAVLGQARAVQATVHSMTGSTSVTLADTGTLNDLTDARDASQDSANALSVVRGGVLHAATVGGADQVTSEASAADVAVEVAGNAITADFVMSRVRAAQGAAAGAIDISGLAVNGVAVNVTGEPNQTVSIVGGSLVINEQQVSAAGVTVNALRIAVPGAADVVVASATAAVQ